jgi:hypothetical protein
MAQAVNEAEVVVVEPATPAAPEPEKRADVSDGKKGNDAATPSSNKMLVVGLIALLVCGTIGGVAAGIVVALDNDDGAPPPPPPLQPGQSLMHTVTTNMIVAGDVNSFNKVAFENALALSLNVQTRDVSVSDVSSASVSLKAAVKTGDDEVETNRVTGLINGMHDDPSQANVQGFTVEAASAASTEVTVVETPPPQAIESITGSWLSDWNQEITVVHLRDSSNMAWLNTQPPSWGDEYMTITQWGDTPVGGWLVAQVVQAAWGIGTWQKIEYTRGYDAGHPTKWAYCTTVYGKDTELEALNAQPDKHTITADGIMNYCGNFNNTIMVTLDLAVAGSFAGNWAGNNYVMTQYSASEAVPTPGAYLNMKVPEKGQYNQIMAYGKDHMFYYNGAGTWDPGSYSKIEWVAGDQDTFYWCTTLWGAKSLQAAFTAKAQPFAYNATADFCGEPYNVTSGARYQNSVWSRQKLDIVGTWQSNWDTTATITTTTWDEGSTSAKIIGYGPPKQVGQPTFLVKQYVKYQTYPEAVGNYNIDEFTMAEDANGSPFWYACSTAFTIKELETVATTDTQLLHVGNATHDFCGAPDSSGDRFSNTKYVQA